MARFILLGLFFISGNVAQVKDNETLIYHWDVHHKYSYYCQFGTDAEISHGNVERQCFRRNYGMQHILPNGVVTYPYLSYGSTIGFLLQCGDIPNGHLYNCNNKNVYTTCKYTCGSSSVTKVIRCELKGPKENVTAQWSITDPCPDHAYTQTVSHDTLTVSHDTQTVSHDTQNTVYTQITQGTTGAAIEQIVIDSLTSKEITDQVTDTANTNTTAVLKPSSADETSIIAPTVSVVCIFALVLLFVLLLLWLQKRNWGLCCKFKKQEVRQESRDFFHNMAVVYSDNAQEAADEADTSRSEVSSLSTEVCTYVLIDDPDYIKMHEVLDGCESMRSNFSTWNNTKMLIEEENGFLTTTKNQQKG